VRTWRVEDSAELYNISGWGIGYFAINEKGNVVVKPRKDNGPAIDIRELMDELALKDINPPVLLRFPNILDHRIEKISGCFERARAEYGYKGKYYNVYPIKVNQQRPVVEEIVRYGKKFNIGLEAGSKPELHAVLPIMDNPEALIICNGYKDEDFIELALLAHKMGKKIFLVVEKLNELRLIIQIARRLNVVPNVGIRIRLSASGSGKWEDSGGDQSKFGLNASELLEAVEMARHEEILPWLKLIHFHLGSQITNIRKIKAGLREVAQFYVQLHRLGCTIEYVDIGGGLGVDYDGSRTTIASSINYSIQEYANDAIATLLDAADRHGLPHPHVITEAGRALTAHHSILVFNVLEIATTPLWDEMQHTIETNDHEIVRELYTLLNNISPRTIMEVWHDALQLREESLELFSLGLLDLPSRAKVERLFWSIATTVNRYAQDFRHIPDELRSLPKLLADKYFCNFSLFQSLPDAWAIDQLFPIMPLQRLNEKPLRRATLHDITCDSDGRIDRFIGIRETMPYLSVHDLREGEPYYIGVFLVGAYQEILGDLHNLFGDTNAVHIVCDEEQYWIDQIIEGETVEDVLDYVQFSAKRLVRTIETWVMQAVKENMITLHEGKQFLAMYRSGLYGYTYLE
jgi:arginine decarboxylase